MIEKVVSTVSKEFSRLNRLTLAFLLFLLILQVVVSFFLHMNSGTHTTSEWLREILLASVILLAVGAIALYMLYRTRIRIMNAIVQAVGRELHVLQGAYDRAQSLQAMASTLSATLSFERVVEQALDVCSLALKDMGVPRESLVGAVFLYDGAMLVPLARRRFLGSDEDKALAGKSGAVGEALRQAEPAVTDNPAEDPELGDFTTFANSLTVVCVPLRAGYQLFGVMVLGINAAVRFDDNHFELFSAVADHAVIALQNAQLYQGLEAEKQRLIDADEEARRKLARDLHDGPTQNIAVMAMRLNFLRSIATKDPQKTAVELEKVEELAKRTSREIRSMLFTLRPLLLETKGLGPAIETMMHHISESDSIEMRLIGGDKGAILNKTTQGVVFSIIEEALSNARKHAEADVVEVHLWQEEDLFVARISDDGIGFDPQAVRQDYESRGSLGMVNMEERANRIDGSLRVESTPESGTTVTLVVPLATQGHQEMAVA
ncbi:MAG: GAF domain-containing sensor histidine kinase [Anaerolineaceae bacterium]|nr:MAG: GAF domain-containing sensor histidine kinase [Anaerolineaceae bacterium]